MIIPGIVTLSFHLVRVVERLLSLSLFECLSGGGGEGQETG